jgi:hypothetical protein
MYQVALLPDDIKIVISSYYGTKQQLLLQNDIIDYSTNINLLVNNTNHQQIRYKLLFWKIMKTHYKSNKINKYKRQTAPSIGSIWGIMNQTERHNFIRHLL